jgi:hypothetical protein
MMTNNETTNGQGRLQDTDDHNQHSQAATYFPQIEQPSRDQKHPDGDVACDEEKCE